jgi:hypothetical protein
VKNLDCEEIIENWDLIRRRRKERRLDAKCVYTEITTLFLRK